MVLLRSVGKLARLGSGKRPRRRRFAARPASATGAPSLGDRLALRQRLRPSAPNRESLSADHEGGGLAQPLHLVGGSAEHDCWAERGKDDRTLRICRAHLLVHRYAPWRGVRL